MPPRRTWIMKLLAICLLAILNWARVEAEERTYYLAIREVNWNYAPSGMNIISGKSVAEDEHASTYLQSGSNRIGRVYKKASYLQYTNDLYTDEIKKPDWLGFLGPIMTAEVGDTITIHLKNFASRPYSLHPHGVQYTKENEGALYPDNTSESQKKDDTVKPGESYTYKWDVVKDQGPIARDEDCVTRIYHSHIDGPRDVFSGLVGPLIICKKGKREEIRKNQDNEFILMFAVIDENLSWYLDENIITYVTDPGSVDKEDEDFQESNKMHSINGYMYGNLPGLSMCENTEVKWFMFGMGNEVDIHSAFFHGQVLTHQRHRVDTISLFPATMVEGTMETKNRGKWLLSCQVNDHLEGGMQAIYEVKNCAKYSKTPCKFSPKIRHYYIAAEEIIWNYGPKSVNQFTGQKLDDPESFLSTGLSYAVLHHEFLIGRSTISGIVRSTCMEIWSRLHQVVMPEPTMEDWLRIARDFEEDCQFPNCIGALDGKHIRVRKPPNSGSQFFNYKQYFSVVLLALADTHYKFIIVDIGAYGRTGDSRVFNTSIMARRLRNNQMDLPPPRQLPGSALESLPYVLVADEAFQLTRHVMRPYPRRNLDHRRRIFNLRLSRARRLVECAFGILTAKWRVLQSAIQLSEQNVNEVVKACVILHNFTRIHDCSSSADVVRSPDNVPSLRPPTNPPRRPLSGLKVRDIFTSYFISPEGETSWQEHAVSML